jgi:hypothetical protein
MKIFFIIFLLLGIIISGCLSNPTKQVPVIHANITLVENQGIVEAENYRLIQGTVNYLNRPKSTQPEAFPAISARAVISKGKNSTIGPWENLAYKGNGTYSFDIGFEEEYPAPGDKINIYIYVWDKNGGRIGYLTQDIIWQK